MEIIENLLPQLYSDNLETMFLDKQFPWFYYTSTYYVDSTGILNPYNIPSKRVLETGSLPNSNTKESQQFVHIFYENDNITSSYYSYIDPIFKFLEIKTGLTVNKIYRIKVNLMLQDISYPENSHNTSHADANTSMPDNCKVLLYYPQNSDGDTFFFNENLKSIRLNDKLTLHSRVTPKKNTAVLFDAKRLHASSPPRNYLNRFALNIVFS